MQDPQAAFESLPFAPSRTVSWIHIGDTHLTRAGEQNEIDLGRIVDEINAIYAHGGVDFVYIPGDIADDGSSAAYELFRSHLDRLKLPWFGIVGDHDAHEKSFANFHKYVATELYSGFSIGHYRFIRLNAFSIPRPDAFILDHKQRMWLESELQRCQNNEMKAVLFLHCYPSDLKQGGQELAALLHLYPVLLVDMGHTHYNEISNDGDLLYTATRSTGQIEEGPVGYSVTTLDHDHVSWHFVELGSPSLVLITSPSDERLITSRTGSDDPSSHISIRTKIWSPEPVQSAMACIAGHSVRLHPEDDVLWSGGIDITGLEDGPYVLEVTATGTGLETTTSSVRFRKGKFNAPGRASLDQQNAIGEWKERGILGTQLGPNKNGRKW